jgi:phosphopantothenoylcysteine synthetase/decarboxylase
MKRKKVLITSGSTWIPIDSVRVITNIFGGKLGIEICRKFLENNFEVTLLIGNPRGDLSDSIFKRARIIYFKYFDELFKLVKKEIKNKQYDIIIHSAAISDYRLRREYKGKIKSGKDNLILELVPTPKIVDIYKKICPNSFLVMFKLEVGKNRKELIEIAKNSMNRARANMVIANDFNKIKKDHKAYIIFDDGQKVLTCSSKEDIANQLIKIINE